jgi:hypothetical protein
VRFHSADYFVGQMERLREKGVTFFFVSDDTFTLKRELVIDICRRIIESRLNIVWVAISRVDCVDEEDARLDAPGRMHPDQLRRGKRQPGNQGPVPQTHQRTRPSAAPLT